MSETLCGIRGDRITYTVSYSKNLKQVTVTGDGYDGEGLLTAVGFKNLTERQASALWLGLSILDYLETGEYSLDKIQLEKQPGAVLNMNE